MNKIVIEVRNSEPIEATVSDDDKFSVKNALMAQTPFITFTDRNDGLEWIVRLDDIVTINVAGDA